MHRAIGYLRTTILGGLVLIIPLGLLAFAAAQVVPIVMEANAFVAEYLPFGPALNLLIALVLVIVVLLALCFLAGLMLRTKVIGGLEEAVAERVPTYAMLRNLVHQVTRLKESANELTPVELDMAGSDVRVLGALVEELQDGRLVVFVPMTPMVSFGQIYIVPAESVHPLDATLLEAVEIASQWGAGARKLYQTAEKTEDTPADDGKSR